MKSPVHVAVVGGSGSGKTWLAEKLAAALAPRAARLSLDDFYRDLSALPTTERDAVNFDDPDAIDWEKFCAVLGALRVGEKINLPVYDFATHTRVVGQTERVTPGAYLVVEGLFALYYPELLPLYSLRVYIETPDEVCFERRVKRDTEQRGRTHESVRRQYEATVRPSSLAFVRPSAVNADLQVDGTGALDWKVERVLTEMWARRLLVGVG